MKRNHDFSSSDSELDENVEVEKESADENGSLHSPMGSMSPSTTTQVQARKRRRGIIEKRRRDRINNSLTELRRLVPSAFEKQGSAKLEKAEILQMTVDHLKMLHAAGGKGYFDAHALAMDYRGLGFRECVAETARYLSLIEGLDGSDPLRMRLVSHLSSHAMQREAQTHTHTHSGLSHLGWGAAFGTPNVPATPHLPPTHPHPHHPHNPLLLPPPPLSQHQQQGMMGARVSRSRSSSPPSSSSSSSSSPASSASSSPPSSGATVLSPSSSPLSSSATLSDPLLPSRLSGSSASIAALQAKLPPPLLTSLSGLAGLTAFPFPLGAFPLLSPRSLSPSSSSSSSSPSSSSAAVVAAATAKPYRPWSMEIGAF